MKITSGEYKYRKIEVPKGIRPTTEKVREAIFSMINQWLPGANIFDMFAGSGAMGLEALSRGAEKCVFCEASRANTKVLLSNINGCGAGSRSTVINKDFKAAITGVGGNNAKFDVVIMDPPYDQTEYYVTAMEMLQEYELLDEGSIVICEHLYDNKLSDTYGKLEKIKDKKYGSIGVSVYFYR
jgi:16S rRNA (guanine(966)-N(2))-methyltransferase RsmD